MRQAVVMLSGGANALGGIDSFNCCFFEQIFNGCLVKSEGKTISSIPVRPKCELLSSFLRYRVDCFINFVNFDVTLCYYDNN
jgi:hypothetical protein